MPEAQQESGVSGIRKRFARAARSPHRES